jgi:hypothetical protein
MEYSHDFGYAISHSIKDHVGSRDNRPESRSYLIARSSSEWMIFEQPARGIDFAAMLSALERSVVCA